MRYGVTISSQCNMAEVVHALKALRSEAMLAFFDGHILSDDEK
jgi:hypothetical protein